MTFQNRKKTDTLNDHNWAHVSQSSMKVWGPLVNDTKNHSIADCPLLA